MANRPPGERGFILIAALWLLVLCGAVAALLMLRAAEGASAAAGEREALRARLALEGAVETTLAEMLFDGARSRWAALPVEGTVSGADGTVTVRVASETGKLDVNHADPALFGRTLAGLGWPAAARTAFAEALAARRESDAPLAMLAELRALANVAGGGEAAACPEAHLTIFSGRGVPEPAHMTPELARATGIAAAGGGGPASAGMPLRIEARLPAGPSLTAVARIGGRLDRPVSVLAWEHGRDCPGG